MAAVSLIVPCYNMEKYIDRCLDSILAQTFKDIQLIVINDGSTDSSEEHILKRKEEIEKTLAEFVYINQDNTGLGGACQTGFIHATGEYFMLLDSDDYIYPESIGKQAEFLRNHPDYALVRTNGYYTYSVNDNEKTYLIETDDSLKQKNEIWEDVFDGNTHALAGAYMVRMSVLDEIYPDRTIYASRKGQNLQFMFLASYKRKAGFIDEPLMKYYIMNSSMSHSTVHQFQKQIDLLEGYKGIRKYLIDHYLPEDDQSVYNHKLELLYTREYIKAASRYGDKQLLNESYAKYKMLVNGRPDKNLQEIYLSARYPAFRFLMKCMHKAKRIVISKK